MGLPPWLVGCGDDDDSRPAGQTPTPTASPTPTVEARPREDCTLHFDLSETELEDLEIYAFGSEDHGTRLQEHNAESRAHFRNENPALMDVADEDLTHFIEDVDLPSDALQLYWVTGCLRSGEDALVGLNIHVPERVRMAMAETAAARGRLRVRSAKMRHYGIGARQEQNRPELYAQVASFVSIYDTAVALLFQQPDLMNINLEQGASILELIETLPCTDADPGCDPFLFTLAFRISQGWPATESGRVTVNDREVEAWARLVPVIGVDGMPVMMSNGEPAMTYDVSDEVGRTAVAVAHELRKLILNSPEFEGFNWHPTRGLTETEETAEVVRNRSRVFMPGQQATQEITVVGEHGRGTTVHGVEFTRIDVADQAKRTVEVEIRNHYIRFVSAYVRYANETGDLPFTAGPNDTERSQFLQLLNPNYTVLGVPLLGDSVERQTLRFDIPENATKARLVLGSLGVGGEAFSPEAVAASVATLGFNIGLPTLFLATGTAASGALQKSITGFMQSPAGRNAIALLIVRAIAFAGPQIANGIFGTRNSGSATPILTSLGGALVSVICSAAEFSAIAVQIAAVFISNRIGDFALPLSWVFKAAALGADVATLAQTVAEVLASPAIFTNTLSLTMSTTVTIFKDPDNATFPDRARFYEVTLTYDQASKLAHKMTGEVPPNSAEPIEVVFDAVPSGGMVSVEVILRTEDDWIVGGSTTAAGELGPVGPIPNNPAMAGAIEITIKEQVIPLTANSRYLHERKLAYQDGARVWVSGAEPPTATRAELCQGQDDRLCNLVGITISQRTGNLGYGFQAGSQGVPYCGEVSSGVMYMVQNLSLIAGSDRNLKQLPCGFHQPAGIMYDRLGPADGRGRNFFVQPTGNGFFLQSIVLDASSAIDVNQPLSWGRFSQPMDSLALHPMGYVVGVNRNNHKMEILQLPQAAVNANEAPEAIPFAVQKAGEGDRPGLLRVPVAVTVSDGAILVLEAGNGRVQAFDVSGNPVNIFNNKTSATFELVDPNATYLDIGTDGLGYVFILAFVDAGTSPSHYRLDIYTPEGVFLTRTTGVAAARLAVNTFRAVYTLNYETLAGAPRVEPSISHWVPSTPMS